MLLLGDFNDQETLSIENKSFHLCPDSITDLSDAQVFELVKTGICTPSLNEILSTNLLKTIGDTLPKYISCFSNAGIDGEIRFGIDDNAENVGCPYFSSISIDEIQNVIYNIIKVRVRAPISSSELLKCIEISIVPLEISLNVLSDTATPLYNKAVNDLIKYNDLMETFLEQHAIFLIQHRKYTQQLEKILNITKYRLELVEYITQQSGNKYIYLINELKSDDYIVLPLDNVMVDKKNPTKMFYWIVSFRTLRKTQIGLSKPERPSNPVIYHPRQILCNLPLMRHKFINTNPDIKYCLIYIKLKCSKICNQTSFLDKHHECQYLSKYGYSSAKWIARTRINYINDDGPGCTK